MTARDYRLIAGIIRRHGSVERVTLARAFAEELSAGNPRFDSQRFYDACFEDAPLRDRDQREDFDASSIEADPMSAQRRGL